MTKLTNFSIFVYVIFFVVALNCGNAKKTWGLLRNNKEEDKKPKVTHRGKTFEPTCHVDYKENSYGGICTTADMCDLTVIDKDGHARSAGATFLKHVAGINGEKCSPGESCCADVQCLNGHGHCMDTKFRTCKMKTKSGQCPGGKTVTCCPNSAKSLQKYDDERFADNKKCLGGEGICRLRSTGNCEHSWVGNQCGKGKEVCCPKSAGAEAKWKKVKVQKMCNYVGPAAAHLDIDITILMAFNKVESGGTASAIRFECHKFLQYSKEKVPCTIKPGKTFSMERSENGPGAFKRAFTKDKIAAIKATSFGYFQVMGFYLLQINNNADEALKLFKADPEKISRKLLIMWFTDPTWGKHAAKAARKIKSVNSELKQWEMLVRKFNGNGQIPRYVPLLKKAYTFYKGKCPKRFTYKKDVIKLDGLETASWPGREGRSEYPTLLHELFKKKNFDDWFSHGRGKIPFGAKLGDHDRNMMA
jgi:hypothetical protein